MTTIAGGILIAVGVLFALGILLAIIREAPSALLVIIPLIIVAYMMLA